MASNETTLCEGKKMSKNLPLEETVKQVNSDKVVEVPNR